MLTFIITFPKILHDPPSRLRPPCSTLIIFFTPTLSSANQPARGARVFPASTGRDSDPSDHWPRPKEAAQKVCRPQPKAAGRSQVCCRVKMLCIRSIRCLIMGSATRLEGAHVFVYSLAHFHWCRESVIRHPSSVSLTPTYCHQGEGRARAVFSIRRNGVQYERWRPVRQDWQVLRWSDHEDLGRGRSARYVQHDVKIARTRKL